MSEAGNGGKVTYNVSDLLRDLNGKLDDLSHQFHSSIESLAGQVRGDINGLGQRLATVEHAMPQLTALDKRMDDGTSALGILTQRLALHEAAPAHDRTTAVLDQHDQRITRIEQRVVTVEQHEATQQAVQTALTSYEQRLDDQRRWLTVLVASSGLTVLGLVVSLLRGFGLLH